MIALQHNTPPFAEFDNEAVVNSLFDTPASQLGIGEDDCHEVDINPFNTLSQPNKVLSIIVPTAFVELSLAHPQISSVPVDEQFALP